MIQNKEIKGPSDKLREKIIDVLEDEKPSLSDKKGKRPLREKIINVLDINEVKNEKM